MDSLATEGDPIMLYIVAILTSFEAVVEAERAATAASAAAWPSGKRSLPSTKVGLCHTKPSFIGGVQCHCLLSNIRLLGEERDSRSPQAQRSQYDRVLVGRRTVLGTSCTGPRI